MALIIIIEKNSSPLGTIQENPMLQKATNKINVNKINVPSEEKVKRRKRKTNEADDDFPKTTYFHIFIM